MTDLLEAKSLEVELKYRMTDVATGERLLATDDLAGFAATGPAETVRHEDRYLDTDDGALEAAGYSGRLRSTGRGTIITLKGLERQDDGGATHRREELEGPADASMPPALWPPSTARDAVVEIVGDRTLRDLVSLRQVRRKRNYARNGTVVEMSVDDVEVMVGLQVAERFAELELELRDGQEVDLEPLADMLGEIEELVAVESSKFERALEVVRREPREPENHESEGARGWRRRSQRGRARAVAQPLRRAATQAPEGRVERATRARRDPDRAGGWRRGESRGQGGARPDGTRDIRRGAGGGTAPHPRPEVAGRARRRPSRRGRSQGPPLPPGPDGRARGGHPRGQGIGGAARDARRDPPTACGVARVRRCLRPQAHGAPSTPPAPRRGRPGRGPRPRRPARGIEAYQGRQSEEESAGLEPLVRSWRMRREAARGVLVRELDAERYTRWLDGYLAFVQSEGQGVHAVGPTEPHRVRDTMPSRVWSAYESVRAYESVMRWADVPTLHELRIAAKWLRYTLEFVREALGRDAGPVIERVVALQDHLGWLHDADVAAGLARAFLVEHAGDLTEAESAAIGRYLVDRERTLAKLRRTVGVPWRGVSSLAFRRSLGRLVAGL